MCSSEVIEYRVKAMKEMELPSGGVELSQLWKKANRGEIADRIMILRAIMVRDLLDDSARIRDDFIKTYEYLSPVGDYSMEDRIVRIVAEFTLEDINKISGL